MRAALVFTLLLSSTAALAQRPDKAAPDAGAGANVGVVVTGEATIQPQVASQLESWLERHGHQLVASPLPPDAVNTMIDCFVIEDESCAHGVVEKRSKARAVVFARIDVNDGGSAIHKDVTLTAYWFDKNRKGLAANRVRRCKGCNEVTLRNTTDELITDLAGTEPTAGRLKCESTPPGATVAINGKKVGSTPLDHPLIPGSYKVKVSHANHADEEREVVIKTAETSELAVSLARIVESRPRRILPITTMIAGGLLIAAGTAMIAFDEDEDPDTEPFINNTAPAGVGLAIAGAVVTAGGFLWFRLTGERSAAPVAAVTRDSAYVGWVQRF